MWYKYKDQNNNIYFSLEKLISFKANEIVDDIMKKIEECRGRAIYCTDCGMQLGYDSAGCQYEHVCPGKE